MQPSEPSAEALEAVRRMSEKMMATVDETGTPEEAEAWVARWFDEFAAQQHAALLREVADLRARVALVGDGWTGADTPPPVDPRYNYAASSYSADVDVLVVQTGYYRYYKGPGLSSRWDCDNIKGKIDVLAWRAQAPHDGGEGVGDG